MRRLLSRAGVAGLLLSVFTSATVANAGGASAAQGSPSEGYEVRLGGFAHGVGSSESGSADINAELIFAKPWSTPDPATNWLLPRPHIGAMINTNGKTSYVYAGALWTYDFTNRIFAETFLGGALHDGSLNGSPGHAALGCDPLFHVGGSLGYRVAPRWSVMFTFDHISDGNAVLHACAHNVGLNEYGIRLGYSF